MINPRVAGRLGTQVELNMQFNRNAEPDDPFAIRRIDIYRGSVRPENLITQIPIADPSSTIYPFPIVAGTDIGSFTVIFEAPDDLVPGDIYFDVWNFLGDDPGTAGIDDESLWIAQEGRFYLFDDVWVLDDLLSTLNVDFEPLDKNLRRGEIRTIELAVYPLPLYDHDWNKLIPIIPQLDPKITIKTNYDELIADQAPCRMGVRQDANRNSPFVIQCLIDTRTLLRGTYKYFITVQLGDQIITSDYYYFTVQ